MAVTIDEVQVEVSDRPQQSQPAAATPREPKIDLTTALERLRERQARLKAD